MTDFFNSPPVPLFRLVRAPGENGYRGAVEKVAFVPSGTCDNSPAIQGLSINYPQIRTSFDDATALGDEVLLGIGWHPARLGSGDIIVTITSQNQARSNCPGVYPAIEAVLARNKATCRTSLAKLKAVQVHSHSVFTFARPRCRN
jgi:hypothetical protein